MQGTISSDLTIDLNWTKCDIFRMDDAKESGAPTWEMQIAWHARFRSCFGKDDRIGLPWNCDLCFNLRKVLDSAESSVISRDKIVRIGECGKCKSAQLVERLNEKSSSVCSEGLARSMRSCFALLSLRTKGRILIRGPNSRYRWSPYQLDWDLKSFSLELKTELLFFWKLSTF
jgi:hypothetical protein